MGETIDTTTIAFTIPLGGVSPTTYAEAVRMASFELQAHAEVCEDQGEDGHYQDVEDALSLLDELITALSEAVVV